MKMDEIEASLAGGNTVGRELWDTGSYSRIMGKRFMFKNDGKTVHLFL